MNQEEGKKLPGMIIFAGVTMFVACGFLIVSAVTQFADSSWLIRETFGWFGGGMLGWAIYDLILAGVAAFTGGLILGGLKLGGILGFIIAGLAAAKWFFFIPAAPVLAVIVIVVAFLVIYGLASEWDSLQ